MCTPPVWCGSLAQYGTRDASLNVAVMHAVGQEERSLPAPPVGALTASAVSDAVNYSARAHCSPFQATWSWEAVKRTWSMLAS